MKEYIEDTLKKQVDIQKTDQYKTRVEFRQVMLKHFNNLNLS